MFLTVEGIEGAGKSTFLGLLERALAKRGVNFLRTREPGGCALGQQIRPLLLDVFQKISDRAELFLFLADRAQHVADTIRPALKRGQWVICDRYADSTIAYQGYGRGMDPEELQRLNDYATDGLWLAMDAKGLPKARAALKPKPLPSTSVYARVSTSAPSAGPIASVCWMPCKRRRPLWPRPCRNSKPTSPSLNTRSRSSE